MSDVKAHSGMEAYIEKLEKKCAKLEGDVAEARRQLEIYKAVLIGAEYNLVDCMGVELTEQKAKQLGAEVARRTIMERTRREQAEAKLEASEARLLIIKNAIEKFSGMSLEQLEEKVKSYERE